MGKLNEALDASIRDRKLSNEDVAKALDLYTAAAIGNYRRGTRKVPSDLIEKWEEVYGESLSTRSKTNVLKGKTNVSRETLKQEFKEGLEKEVLTMEMWKQVQKDTDKKDEQIRNLWKLIGRLELPGDAIKGVPTDNS